jgi:hypothetical protein
VSSSSTTSTRPCGNVRTSDGSENRRRWRRMAEHYTPASADRSRTRANGPGGRPVAFGRCARAGEHPVGRSRSRAPACQRREREPGRRQHTAPLGVIGQRQGDAGHTTRSSGGPAQFDDGRVVRGRCDGRAMGPPGPCCTAQFRGAQPSMAATSSRPRSGFGTHWVHKTFANVQRLPTLDLTKWPSQLAHSPVTNASR